MSLGDRIRAFFNKRHNPALAQLSEWASQRRGVEGYIEPRTTTNPTTLLLVDREGDHLRAPVREPEDAVAFCNRHSFPVYDAAVIGYPKRMRDFDRRRKGLEQTAVDETIEAMERRLQEPGPPDTPNR